MDNFEKFTISQVGIIIKDNKCLILEDKPHPGQYVLPGGRIDKGEDSKTTFARELKEEIGVKQFSIIDILYFDTWKISTDKMQAGVAFLVEINQSEVQLSDEHLSMRWIKEDELKNINFVWPKGKQMVQAGFNYNK